MPGNNALRRKPFREIIIFSLAIVALLSGCITMDGPAVTVPETGEPSSPAAAQSTLFEVYSGTFQGRAGSPYQMLLVRSDGFVYYETGTRNHYLPTSNFTMRQGQLTMDEVTALKVMVDKCPREIHSKFGKDQPAFTGTYGYVFLPTRAIWAYEQTGVQITTNFNPLSQNLIEFPDISDEAKAFWAEVKNVVKATVPTDIHPDLWPDQYFDGRNYELRPDPLARL